MTRPVASDGSSMAGPRVLVAELDSLTQARIWRDSSNRTEAIDRLLGFVRAAHLLGGRVLLLDSMVLDSALFGVVSPRRLAAHLGVSEHDLPVTLVCESASLADSLEAKLGRGVEYRWQLAGGRQRDQLWIEDSHRRGWDAWCEAADSGLIPVETYRWRADVEKPPLAIAAVSGADLKADSAAERLRLFANGTTRRSDVEDEFDRGVEAAPDEKAALTVVRDQWNRHYLDALARQHDASWVSFDSQVESSGDSPPDSGRTLMRVSGAAIERLRRLPPAAFSDLLYMSNADRERFFSRPSRRALWRIAYRIETVDRVDGLPTALLRLALTLVLVIVALVLTSPALEGATGAWAWLLSAAVVLATFPYPTLSLIWHVRPKRLDGVVSMAVAP